jgi:hypothetical protein
MNIKEGYKMEQDQKNGCYSAIERTIIIRKKTIRDCLKKRHDKKYRECIHLQIEAIKEERNIIDNQLIN